MNDGRCDRDGRFIVGEMYIDNFAGPTIPPLGRTFQVQMKRGMLDVQQIKQIPGVYASNSVCFSPRGTTMYHSDTFGKYINAYSYVNQTGEISNKRAYHSTADYPSNAPDGSCMNSKGQVWTSHVMSQGTVELTEPIDPKISGQGSGKAKVVRTVELGVKCPTCPGLGGPNYDWLFVTTTSGFGAPATGGLYVTKVETKGLPESRFFDYMNV